MTVSGEIIKILDDLGKRFGIAVDWTSTNVIPYLEDLGSRFIKYEIVTNVIWMVLALIVGVTACLILRKYKEFGVDTYGDGRKEYGNRILFYVIAIGIPLFVFMTNMFDTIPCVLIPEKVIFDELSYIYSNL